MTGHYSKPARIKAAIKGMSRLPLGRQLALVLGFIACIVLAFYLVNWVRPDGSVLSAMETTSQMNLNNKSTAVAGAQLPRAALATSSIRVWEAGQLLFAVMLAVLLVLGVFRPLLRDLASAPSAERAGMDVQEVRLPKNTSVPHAAEAQNFTETQDYHTFLHTVRSLARDDPRRVAQLLKSWLNENSSR